MKPTVSIVIPCYNAANYLGETLQSIANQSYKNIEVILVNDGSTDKSLELAYPYESKINLTILNIPNGGVSNARNIGFQHTTGEFIVFLDADDILKPTFAENKIALLVNNHADACGSVIEHFRMNSGKREITTKLISATENFEESILGFREEFSTVPSAYLLRKSAIHTKTPFNLNLNSTADRYFLLEYERQFKFILDDNPDSGLLYRVSETSMSHNFNKKLVHDNEQFYHEIQKNLSVSKRYLKKGYWMLMKAYLKVGALKKGATMLAKNISF